MPVSPETEQKMKQIEEETSSPTAEEMADPKQGWQCPTCGAVYEKEGICPVDQSLLTRIENWADAAPSTEGTTPEEVMETGDELYPTAER